MKTMNLSDHIEDNGDYRNYKARSEISFINHSDGAVYLQWDDGEASEFDETWLQDNCSCKNCVHPTTLEPLTHFTEKCFSGIDKVHTDNSGLHVAWKDGHKSYYGNGWLRSHTFSLKQKHSPQFNDTFSVWDASSLQVPEFQYTDIDDPNTMYNALKDLQRFGLIIVKNAPREDKLVVRFAKKIGDLRATAFGKYFDVIAKVEPNSNGYTSLKLHPHIDLAYYEAPPTYQLLHFLDNDAEGGFSTLVDGFQISKVLKEKQPEIFRQLTRPIYTFRFQDHKTEHSFRGPIIELDDSDNPKRIRMDFDTIEPLVGSVSEVRNARKAIETFFNCTVDKKFQYTRKLDAGDLMMITNTRLLHGRTAFKATSGKRRLQVCYLDHGEVISYMQVLKRTLENTDNYVFDDSGQFLMNIYT